MPHTTPHTFLKLVRMPLPLFTSTTQKGAPLSFSSLPQHNAPAPPPYPPFTPFYLFGSRLNRPMSDLMFRIVDDAVAGVASCSSVTSFAYLPPMCSGVFRADKRVYMGCLEVYGVYTCILGVCRYIRHKGVYRGYTGSDMMLNTSLRRTPRSPRGGG